MTTADAGFEITGAIDAVEAKTIQLSIMVQVINLQKLYEHVCKHLVHMFVLGHIVSHKIIGISVWTRYAPVYFGEIQKNHVCSIRNFTNCFIRRGDLFTWNFRNGN